MQIKNKTLKLLLYLSILYIIEYLIIVMLRYIVFVIEYNKHSLLKFNELLNSELTMLIFRFMFYFILTFFLHFVFHNILQKKMIVNFLCFCIISCFYFLAFPNLIDLLKFSIPYYNTSPFLYTGFSTLISPFVFNLCSYSIRLLINKH
jgi:hypothetical protein